MLDPLGIGDVDAPCRVDPELDDLLKTLGFSPGAPIYRATPHEPFSEVFKRIIGALCGSRILHPGFLYPGGLECEPVQLGLLRRDKRYGPFSMTILTDLVQAVHEPHRMVADGPMATGKYVPAFSKYSDPNWYIRGTLLSTRSEHNDSVGPIKRFHAYIQSDPDSRQRDWPHGMIVQLVTPSTDANPEDPLTWGIGLPTRPGVPTSYASNN